MERIGKRVLLTVLALVAGYGVYGQQPVDCVNMMIGTDGAHPTEYGGTTPAVSEPFGMTQWCAATRVNGISRTMYHHADTTSIGFMATHQPAIWMGDYGFMTLMPQSGSLKIAADERRTAFDRADEVARPYYYRVTYGGEGITTELTATSRASFFRIGYPADRKAILYLEAGRNGDGGSGHIEIFPDRREVHIWNSEVHDAHLGPEMENFRGYYVLKFSAALEEYGTWSGTRIDAGQSEAEGPQVGGYVVFPAGTVQVELRIGSSFIGFGQAADNMERELAPSFRRTVGRVRGEWNRMLSKVRLYGAGDDDRTIFYTAFFRTLQFPREFSEYGRYYSPFDGRIHDGVSYTAFSLWDTFRAEHPWLQLVASERVNDMVTALVQMYEQGGWIPKWPNPTYTNIMIGTHADAVIADAYVNGFRGYDVETAYRAIRKDAYVPPKYDDTSTWGDRALWNGQYEARGGLTNYLEKGYVASDRTSEAVARTLEFALDDYCIAQMARGLGKTGDYDDLMARSRNYRNLFNTSTGCFQARRADGSWDGAQVGFTEGSNLTYQFCVMQDVAGLIGLMGGAGKFAEALDFVFDNGHYRHDNEPCHHYVYLYDYCGRHDMAQRRLPGILEANYRNSADGLSGNDDCGQMSAWYLFSSLGFYPVTPASGEYALGIPHFPKIRMDLPGRRRLTIRAVGLGEHDVLPVVRFNGQRLDKPFITTRELLRGGELTFGPDAAETPAERR